MKFGDELCRRILWRRPGARATHQLTSFHRNVSASRRAGFESVVSHNLRKVNVKAIWKKFTKPQISFSLSLRFVLTGLHGD